MNDILLDAIEASPEQVLQRFERLHVSIRCALAPGHPASIRLYLHCGAFLVQRGQLGNEATQRRMFGLLLQTARDCALPLAWRSLCLEHVWLPMAKLAWLTRRRDPIAFAAIEAAVQMAHDRLAAAVDRQPG
jgi:hypothetical protein